MKIIDYSGPFTLIELEDRRFPGIVMQGDRLALILDALLETMREISSNNPSYDSANVAIQIEDLENLKEFYASLCLKLGLHLPWE